jgi:hypothetical protein
MRVKKEHFLTFHVVWDSNNHLRTLSYFCNPPLEFIDTDTRDILAYPYLMTLIPA